MVKNYAWPEYPKAHIIKNQIYVFFEDGSNIIWSEEEEDKIESVMTEIQERLRAIEYISSSLRRTIHECLSFLEARNIPKNKRDEYLIEAVRKTIYKHYLYEKNDHSRTS